MKYLPLIFLISLPASAQFSFFKKKTSSVKVTYECKGKVIEQKIKFKTDDDVVSAKVESDCPEKLLASLETSISEEKKKCSSDDKGAICTLDSSVLKNSLQLIKSDKIETAKPDKNQSNSKISDLLAAPSEPEAQKIFDSKVDEVIANPAKCSELPIAQDSNRLYIMVRFPNVFSKAIDKLAKAQSPCLIPLMDNYQSLLSQHSVENKPEVQAYCQKNSESAECQKVKTNLEQIDRNIRKLIVAQRGKDGEVWLESNSCQNTPFKDYADLGLRIKEYEKEMKCMPLQNNSERIVLDSAGKPIYRLSKDADGNIETALSLNFQGPPVDGVTPSEMFQRAQKCLNSATKYLAPPGVKGFKVKIMSASDARAEGVPVHDIGLTTSDTPKDQNVVSYADKYRTDIPCGIIAHEVMHLLGLPDEYKHDGSSECFTAPPLPSLMGGKKGDNKSGNWNENVPQALQCECSSDDCKKMYALPDQDLKRFYSLQSGGKLNNTAKKMKCTEVSVNEKWSDVKNKKNLQRMDIQKDEPHIVQYTLRNLNNDYAVNTLNVKCECDPSDTSCLGELKKEVSLWKSALGNKDFPDRCPAGFKKKSLFPSEGEGEPGSIKLGDNSFTLYTKTRHTGMLLPAQVALIASGHCPTVSRKYTACFAWGSYNDGDEVADLPDDVREANANGIGQCKNDASASCVKVSCSNRPKYCDDLSTYLNP